MRRKFERATCPDCGRVVSAWRRRIGRVRGPLQIVRHKSVVTENGKPLACMGGSRG